MKVCIIGADGSNNDCCGCRDDAFAIVGVLTRTVEPRQLTSESSIIFPFFNTEAGHLVRLVSFPCISSAEVLTSEACCLAD
jgi:hypothetical protein